MLLSDDGSVVVYDGVSSIAHVSDSSRIQQHLPIYFIIMPFAQLIIGPPGSGKSTFCNGMQQLLTALERKCSVVNLDPANDHTSYPAALDVRDLVPLDEIMEAEDLGPNGGVLYALEELEHNFEWLEDGLNELGGKRLPALNN
jgi:GTPase SAR1 family protein